MAYKGHSKGNDGRVACVEVEADLGYASSGRKPPKGVLNWVGQPQPGQEPLQFEVRARRGMGGRCRREGGRGRGREGAGKGGRAGGHLRPHPHEHLLLRLLPLLLLLLACAS